MAILSSLLSFNYPSDLCVAFKRILVLTSPHLVSLHAIFTFYRQSLVLPFQLPMLSELTLQGPVSQFSSTIPIPIPTLRRMTIIDAPLDFSEPSLAVYGVFAPNLTHLRIAPQGSLGKPFVECLRDALGVQNSKDGDSGTSTATLPSTLAELHIQLPKERQRMSFEGPTFSLEGEIRDVAKSDSRLRIRDAYDWETPRPDWGHKSAFTEWTNYNLGRSPWTI